MQPKTTVVDGSIDRDDHIYIFAPVATNREFRRKYTEQCRPCAIANIVVASIALDLL